MSCQTPLNTAENRAALMQFHNARSDDVMTEALAGGLLLFGAMPEGPAKQDIHSVAHVLANTWPRMTPHVALGGAYLLKISHPATFDDIARQEAAAEAAAATAANDSGVRPARANASQNRRRRRR